MSSARCIAERLRSTPSRRSHSSRSSWTVRSGYSVTRASSFGRSSSDIRGRTPPACGHGLRSLRSRFNRSQRDTLASRPRIARQPHDTSHGQPYTLQPLAFADPLNSAPNGGGGARATATGGSDNSMAGRAPSASGGIASRALALLRHFFDGHERAHGVRAVRAGYRRNQPANEHSTHRWQRERRIGLAAPTSVLIATSRAEGTRRRSCRARRGGVDHARIGPRSDRGQAPLSSAGASARRTNEP